MKSCIMVVADGTEIPLFQCETMGEALVRIVQGLNANGVRVLSKAVQGDDLTILCGDLEILTFKVDDIQ